MAHVDRKVGAQALADRQARIASAGQDDALRAEGLAELDRDEADGSGPEDEHRFAGDVAAHEIDGPER